MQTAVLMNSAAIPAHAYEDDRFLTSAATKAFVGDVSDMCIWRWLRDPRVQFPEPVKINNRNYWRLGDLRRWQAERMNRAA